MAAPGAGDVRGGPRRGGPARRRAGEGPALIGEPTPGPQPTRPWDGVWERIGATFPGRADEPVPVDATDRLLLDETADAVRAAGPGAVVVLDDRFGALTLAVAALLGTGVPVRVHQDALTASARLRRAAESCDLADAYLPFSELSDPALLAGARVVLATLPRSLAALRETAELVAAHAAPDVALSAGGRVKHMTPAMNDVLAESFDRVRPGLARGKSRVLVATGPRPRAQLTYPVRAMTDAGPVVAHGAAFAGAGLDLGTRALLSALEAEPVDPSGEVHRVVDLGCGTGVLAAWAARRWPAATVLATDHSAAALASAAATASAQGVTSRVTTRASDAGEGLPGAWADVVLCNPPFHDGAALRTDTAHRMFASAARMLRPGGVLWCVWNSHLRYRPALERSVGPTLQVARDRRFTVTMSRRS